MLSIGTRSGTGSSTDAPAAHGAGSQPRGIGTWPATRLGLAFIVPTVVCDLWVAIDSAVALPVGLFALTWTLAFIAVVAWYRDDDLLEAGVLIAIVTGVAALLGRMILQAIVYRSVWPVVLALPGAFIGLALRGLVAGTVGVGVIWLLRLFRGRPERT